MKKLAIVLAGLLAVGTTECQNSSVPLQNNGDLSWAEGAIWYQIFPERFRNGDSGNDPTVAEVPETNNPHWRVTSWTSDWYQMQPWEKESARSFYDLSAVFARRYGGDLIGVIQKLDYLQKLGIDAIYFNPLFEAGSLHKYDGSTYHHIDDNFGPDPVGDKQKIDSAHETEDPKTWIWTRADSTFLQLIREAHARGIRIVIDGVFNHTGRGFFAFQDLLKNGPASRYAHWYQIERWDDPTTPEDEFSYKSWWGVKTLPELAEDKNGIVSGPREYIFAATRRWMDPNGDGNPEDGIDGWRLDVVEEVAPPFWREWYALVKSINPAAITVAEIWNDASRWIRDQRMDDTMNYLFAYAVCDFFIDRKTAISSQTFQQRLQKILDLYGKKTAQLLWNLIDSHDTDRLASMILNPDRNYDRNNGLRDNPDYLIRKPTRLERKIQKQIVAFQMTFIGAPVIYYGDEAGMWGADDPDDRKPMLWPDMNFVPEASHPLPGRTRPVDENSFDRDLFVFYQKMIKLRHENPALRRGDLVFFDECNNGNLFAFSRNSETQQVVLLFNRGEVLKKVTLPKKYLHFPNYFDPVNDQSLPAQKQEIEISIPGRWFALFVSK